MLANTSSRMRRVVASSLILAAGVTPLAACDQVSDETKAQAVTAACASARSNVSTLEAQGAGAKALASLIHDASDDERVRAAAKKVMEGDADTQAVATLTSWVDEFCS